MVAGFAACNQNEPDDSNSNNQVTTTNQDSSMVGYAIVLLTDNLENATAELNKTTGIGFADKVTLTITSAKSYKWENKPTVTVTNAIMKNNNKLDDCTYSYVFTAFEDNSVISVSGAPVFSPTESDIVASGKHNGHDYVDLGLPSGLLWATCNIGSYSPIKPGSYFAWGETYTKSDYSECEYRYFDCYDDYSLRITKYNFQGANLELSDDAANANWGGNWRMPSNSEFNELCNHCTWIWSSIDSRYGYFIIGPNENAIFLPCGGFVYGNWGPDFASSYGLYWSATSHYDYSKCACALFFDSSKYSTNVDYYNGRNYGRSVRPVFSPQ